MNKNLLLPLLAVFIALLGVSCVKDTDFSQTDEITLTPVVELNLIHFDLDAGEFFDETTSTPRLTIVDTTEIRFLDDEGFQESLIRAEFLFRFTNSIPRSFEVDYEFVSEDNEITYMTSTAVNEGSIAAPVVTEDEKVLEGQDILNVTSANRVVVRVTIPSANAALEGNLNLKSKTTYFLEVRERE